MVKEVGRFIGFIGRNFVKTKIWAVWGSRKYRNSMMRCWPSKLEDVKQS